MWFSDRFAVVCSQLQQQDIVMLQRIVAIWCEVKPKFCVFFFYDDSSQHRYRHNTIAGATSELVRAAATINSLSLPIVAIVLPYADVDYQTVINTNFYVKSGQVSGQG